MEEILAVLVFGVGAAVGMKAAQTVGSGFRPIMRGVLRGGMVAAETARSAASRAGETVVGATSEARKNLDKMQAEVRAEKPASRPRRRASAPRRIAVAKR